jgi:hypothetical protein
VCLYAPTNPARVDEMGVKLNFNNFRAEGAQRVSIEELRLILKDGACEETSPNGPRASVDVTGPTAFQSNRQIFSKTLLAC